MLESQLPFERTMRRMELDLIPVNVLVILQDFLHHLHHLPIRPPFPTTWLLWLWIMMVVVVVVVVMMSLISDAASFLNLCIHSISKE